MRRRRAVAASILATVMIAAVAAAVLLADGRSAAETETNDGGAWLINRNEQAIGHVDRASRELTGVISGFSSGDFVVDQAGRTVIVHDRGAAQLRIVDPSSATTPVTIAVPSGAAVRVYALADGVVVADGETGRVWRLDRIELATIRVVEEETPDINTQSPVQTAVGTDGAVAVFDTGTGDLTWLTANAAKTIATAAPRSRGLLTVVGDRAVLAFDDGRLVVVSRSGSVEHGLDSPLVQIQQPSPSAPTVVGIEADGDVVEIDLGNGQSTVRERLQGGAPLPPIVHRGCVWVVTTMPEPAFEFCGQPPQPIAGVGAELQLRLVNGWVWLNNVRTGDVWTVDEDLDLQQLSDWSTVILSEIDEDAAGTAGGEDSLRLDPDAGEIDPRVLEPDAEGENQVPVAVDDEAATRLDRPVVVDVLRNDADPDNDPLVVVEIFDVVAPDSAQGLVIEPTADGRAVQVTSPEGFQGQITFSYTITDGRGGDASATVTLQVLVDSSEANRAPQAAADNAKVRAGESVSLNVVANDRDPDGDVILLVAVESTAGTGAVSFTSDGEIVYRPDTTSPDGVHELEYTVVDDYGAEATGTVRIFVRPENSNEPPVALSDVGSTKVGRAVTLDVLANDSDPDGDLLTARGLRAIEPADADADLAADGAFLYTPTTPGTHRFVYVASDGPSAVEAQIRIEVSPGDENRPPVAVRDDVTLTAGETRMVRVLDNDGDPDGDVVAIVGRTEAPGLSISEVDGVGFLVTAAADAPPRSTFYYWISDGTAPDVRGAVVVSLTAVDPTDRPPVANPDVVDARAGQTTVAAVLVNDFDPDGGALTIVGPVGDRAELPEASIRITPDGSQLLVSIPETQQFGFSFAYDVVDDAGNRASAAVDVRVVPATQPNRPPIARPDIVRTQEDTPEIVDVLFNDSDPDGDPISIEGIARQPRHGSAEVLEDGRILYTPASGYSGPDEFGYTLIDGYTPPAGVEGEPLRAVGEVLVGVMPEVTVNREPSAIDDIRIVPTVEIGGPAVPIPVLRNDTDPDGDPLVVTAVTTVGAGQVAIAEGGGSVVYTPPAEGESREVAFGYTISDQAGGTASAQVVLDLETAPDPLPPIALDDTVGPLRAGSSHTFDPRLNDDPPTGLQVVDPGDGSFTIGADGLVTVTVPEATVQIPYRVVSPDGLESNTANITVLVVPNQAPIVPVRSVDTPFETAIDIDLHLGVSDPDDDVLFYTPGTSVTGGSVQTIGPVEQDRLTVRFTPDPLFEGAATFDFLVDDQQGHTIAAAMTVRVGPPGNRPPVATDASLTATAGIPEPFDLDGLVSDLDIERDPTQDSLTFTVSAATNGLVTLGVDPATGVVTISSTPDLGGETDSFTYTATDEAGEAAQGTINVTLTPSAHAAPIANADSARTLQTQPLSVTPLENDTDNSPQGLEGDGLLITEVGTTPDGTVEILDGSTITFTPDPTFFGTATFTYTVQDGRRLDTQVGIGTVNVEVVGFPAQPQPPAVDSFGDRYCVLTWNTPAGNGAAIDGYILDYTDSFGGTGHLEFLSDPATNYRWDGLDNATIYQFTVTAVNEAGTGVASVESSPCTPDVRPEPPSTPLLTFGDRELDITWPDAVSAGSPVINYQIEIGGGQTLETRETQSNATSLLWTGLTNGTDYQFRVRAQNSAAADNNGWSDWSPWSAGEHPLTVPTAPAKPQVAYGDRQVIISWNEPYDGGDTISTYDVQREGTSNWIQVTAVPGANQYTWTDLANGDPVRFRVRAVNRDPLSGTDTSTSVSLWSDAIAPGDVPDAPPTPTVVRGDTSVTVSWTPPNDQGYPILDYTIENNLGATQTASAGATDHVFTGLTNGTPYTFTVTANNAVTLDGNAGKPSPSSASVTPAGPPLAPTITSANPDDQGSVALTWTAAGPNGGTLTAYEISNNGGSSWITRNGTATSYTWTGLARGTTYNFRVRGVNVEAGSGAASANVSVTTPDVPSAPGGLSASPGNGSIAISWNAAAANGSAVTGYEVLRTTGGSCSGGDTDKPVSPRTHTFNGLNNGTSYRVCVRAVNSVGRSSWSSRVATPVAPKVVTLTRGASCTGVVFPDGSVCGGSGSYVNVQISGFTPNRTYTYLCQSDDSGGTNYTTYVSTVTISTNGSGSGSRINSTSGCWYGFPNGSMRVVVDGVSDTVRPWGS